MAEAHEYFSEVRADPRAHDVVCALCSAHDRDGSAHPGASASDSAASATRINNEASRALTNIDNALEKILTVQSDVGTRIRRAEMQIDTNDAFNYQLKETLSGLQDLDYAEAISRLNIQMLALQAAQQTFAKTQTMSLFNYL